MPYTQVPNFTPALPEIMVAIAAMLLLLYGVFRGNKSTYTISVLSAFLLAVVLAVVVMISGDGVVAFEGQFIADRFARFMKVLVILGSAFAIVASVGYLDREKIMRFEYPVLMLLATLGMMLMISAGDLMSLYLGIELQSLSLYIIAAFRRDSLRSTEAGLKYFVLGALSSGLLLYGISMTYGFAGSTGFSDIAKVFAGQGAAEAPIGVIVGLVFVIAGLAFKISAVPFHMWTPDVYEGAPTPVTAFFSVAPKIAALALFIRVLIDPFGDLVDQWRQIIWFLAFASMLLGAFAAINQTNIKRLMAYSAIGHVGYALVGLAAGSEAGVSGILIYMTVYLFMTAGTFAVILCMRRNGRMVEGINDLAGLSRTHPGLALALAIFMFSLAGIPPLAGFFAKFYVFLAAVEAGLYVLAVIGVLTSVVGAFYYLRIIKIMYFDEPAESFDKPFGRELNVIIGGAALAVLLFFLYPSPVLTGASVAAASLFAG
jgi:NADH-quinone oxidoreductase subunit N